MTRQTNAQLAGLMVLFYIAVAFPSMVLMDRAASGEGTASRLVSIAEHASDVRVVILLSGITCFVAPVLAVALYVITRDQDHELAVLALSCRVGEGVLSATYVLATLGLLWLATAAGSSSSAATAAQALGAFLLKVQDWNMTIGATFFAVGSTIFSWLLLRGRMVPVPLAWLGVFASVLLVMFLPLEIRGAMSWSVWMPMLVFEVALGLWLLIKGVAATAQLNEPATVTVVSINLQRGSRDQSWSKGEDK